MQTSCGQRISFFLTWPSNSRYAPMSQAFMRESDDQSLSDISPTMKSLILFLTRENNGIGVYEKENFNDPRGQLVHRMSNGLSYSKNKAGRWQIV